MMAVPDGVVGGEADGGDEDLEDVGADEDGVVAVGVGAEDGAVAGAGGDVQAVLGVADLHTGLLRGGYDVTLGCVGELEVCDDGALVAAAGTHEEAWDVVGSAARV